MDDRPARVGRERTEGRADEEVRGYAGATPSDAPSSEYRTAPAAPVEGGNEGADPRVREIRAEIERTREDMSETIDAIQERLRPRNIMSQATESVRAATTERVKQMTHYAGDAAGSVLSRSRETMDEYVEGTRRNPIPIALIGIGAAWLLMNRDTPRRGGRRRGMEYDDRGYNVYGARGRAHESEYGGGYDASDDEDSRWQRDEDNGLIGRVKHNPIPAVLTGVGLAWLAMSDSGERDRDDWRSASDGAQNLGSSASDMTSRVTSRAHDVTEDARNRTRRMTRRARNGFERVMHENPLLVGAAAALVGAAVGLALPETERENELMGEARDHVIEQAQDVARSAIKETAGDVAGRLTGGE